MKLVGLGFWTGSTAELVYAALLVKSHLDAKWVQKHTSRKGCSSQETVAKACSVPLSRETKTTQVPDGLLKCCPLFSRWQTSSLRLSTQPMPSVVPQYKVAFLPLAGIGSTKLFMRGCRKSMTLILLPWNQFWHSEGWRRTLWIRLQRHYLALFSHLYI